MYDADALLDELVEVTAVREVDEEDLDLVEKAVNVIDLDDELAEAVDSAVEADTELDLEDESDDLLAVEEGESWSDDPVRMYLDPDGRDSLAQPATGNRPGQAD